MNKKIIFFGTPYFAVTCLEKMVEENIKPVAVVTTQDQPIGRGRQIRKSAVKEFSETQKIPVLQPSNLKDSAFIDQLYQFKPDLMVVVAFRMLPKAVWSLPPFGTINLHASLLPNYRGAAPINWAIINRERETGVTTFFINEDIDSGAILLQEKELIDEEDTAGSLHDKLALKGGDLICKTINRIFEGSILPLNQEFKGNENIAPKLNKENVFIDLGQPIEAILAKIKGLCPYPGAKSKWIDGQQSYIVKIFEAEIIIEKHNFDPKNVIIRDKNILITHPSGYINCKILQFPNKKKMKATEFLNGNTFSDKVEIS